MSVATPASGTPSMAGPGQELDASGRGYAWSRALRGLSEELRARGLVARVDDAVGAVDATDHAAVDGAQRAVLRPHRGSLWWWLRWSGEPPALHVPLAPASDSARAARRIARLVRAL